MMVIFELGEVAGQVTTGVECWLLIACDEIHKLTQEFRHCTCISDRSGTEFQETELRGESVEIDTRSRCLTPDKLPLNLARGRAPEKLNPGLTSAKRTRRSPTHRAGEDTAPLPKNHLPAEGPLFQPSLALNIDPVPVPLAHPHHSVTPSVSHQAQVSSPLSLIQPDRPNSLPSSSPRALYQIQPRTHPRLSELQARKSLSVSLPVAA